MGESLKSIFAVVVSHAAFTKSTERKTVCRKVTDYIVYAAASESEGPEHFFLYPFVFAEQVQSQRSGTCGNKIHCIVKILISEDRQQGTKNFFLHCRMIQGLNAVQISQIQNCWGNLVCGGIDFCFRNHGKKPCKVPRTYDFRIFRICQNIVTIQIFNFLVDGFYKTVLHRFFNKNIVRGNTGLSGVHQLSPDNSPCGHCNICIFFYYTGTFPAKLQTNRGQKLCGILHDKLPNFGASGKEDKIKMLVRKNFGLHIARLHVKDMLRFKNFLDNFLYNFVCGGTQLRTFDDGGIPACNCGHKRLQCKQKRIVPRRNNQNCPIRFRHDSAFCGASQNTVMDFFDFCPFFKVLFYQRNLVEDKAFFGHVCFKFRFRQICVERLRNLFFVIFNRSVQGLEF